MKKNTEDTLCAFKYPTKDICGKPLEHRLHKGFAHDHDFEPGQTVATFDAVLMRAKWANILDGDEYEDRLAGASADIRACLAEIERLGAFEKRILAFRDGLRVDSIDEDGTRYPYMLCGNDADVLEDLEKAING